MADIASLQFELERRTVLFKKNTTMPDSSQLNFDGNPNTVSNGATQGETLIYNCPLGTHFQQSTGEMFYKTSLPNTWTQVGSGSGAVSKFTDLTDVPQTYTSQGNLYVKVKPTEDGLEFTSVTPGAFNTDSIVTAPIRISGIDQSIYIGDVVSLVVVDINGNVVTAI